MFGADNPICRKQATADNQILDADNPISGK